MSTQTIVLWVLGAILILLGGWYVVSSMGGSAEDNAGAALGEALSGDFQGSFAALMARGGNVSCSFEGAEGDEVTSGTFYLSGGKFRGEYVMAGATASAATVEVLYDGEYSYTWGKTAMGDMAVKMKLAQSELTAPQGGASQEGLDMQKDMTYRCAPWTPDQAKFIPPTDIEFMDMSAALGDLEASMNASQSGAEGMCGACDQLEDAEAKSMCRAQLGCK